MVKSEDVNLREIEVLYILYIPADSIDCGAVCAWDGRLLRNYGDIV